MCRRVWGVNFLCRNDGQRWVAEISRNREVRVARVTTRPDVSWLWSRRGRCVSRMELTAPPAETPPVRYFRIECGGLGSPSITRETTAIAFQFNPPDACAPQFALFGQRSPPLRHSRVHQRLLQRHADVAA